MVKKTFYRVRKGDCISTISNLLDVPENAIISLNNLTCEVEEGDLLYIEKLLDKRVYRVLATESLSSIAKKFCISENDILSLNNISYVYMGQKIYLPK